MSTFAESLVKKFSNICIYVLQEIKNVESIDKSQGTKTAYPPLSHNKQMLKNIVCHKIRQVYCACEEEHNYVVKS